jgi:hypothetical protein
MMSLTDHSETLQYIRREGLANLPTIQYAHELGGVGASNSHQQSVS